MPIETIDGFTLDVIIPIIRLSGQEIETMRKLLGDESGLIRFLKTPEFPYLSNTRITVDLRINIFTDIDVDGNPGWFLGVIAVEGKLSLSRVEDIARAFVRWIRASLGKYCENPWSKNPYSTIVIWRTTPQIQPSEIQRDSILQTRLMTCSLPINLKFSSNSVMGLSSNNLGYLEADFYKFSPYGGMIFNVDYPAAKQYIDSTLIPLVSNVVAIRALFDYLNSYMAEKMKSMISDPKKHSNKLTDLREIVLKSLAFAEVSPNYVQLTKIVESLKNMLNFDSVEKSLNNKLQFVDSILQRISDDREKSLNDKISYLNVILAIFGVIGTILGVIIALKLA